MVYFLPQIPAPVRVNEPVAPVLSFKTLVVDPDELNDPVENAFPFISKVPLVRVVVRVAPIVVLPDN